MCIYISWPVSMLLNKQHVRAPGCKSARVPRQKRAKHIYTFPSPISSNLPIIKKRTPKLGRAIVLFQ